MKQATISKAWRTVLECRSVKDKIAVVIDCHSAPIESLPAVTELVRDGYMIWIDRAYLHFGTTTGHDGLVHGPFFNCDVYQLTTRGIALCNSNGIKQR